MESAALDEEPGLVRRQVESPRQRFRGHAGEIENHQPPPVPVRGPARAPPRGPRGAAEAGRAALTLSGGSVAPQ